jgi:hypothetical protein
MFAISKMYITRNSASEEAFPRLHYFYKAVNILCIVSERLSVNMVKIQLLLVCFLSPLRESTS